MKRQRATFDEGILRKKQEEMAEEIEEAEEDTEEEEVVYHELNTRSIMQIVVLSAFTFWFVLFGFVAVSQAKTIWDILFDGARLAGVALYTGIVWGILDWMFR